MSRSIPFARPRRGLIPQERPTDRLAQFFEVRSAFYHCLDLMKELESGDPELVAPIFARAAKRLALAADEFADLPPEVPPNAS